jgi:hypothetical protein
MTGAASWQEFDSSIGKNRTPSNPRVNSEPKGLLFALESSFARRGMLFEWNFFIRYLYNLIEMVSVYCILNAGRF